MASRPTSILAIQLVALLLLGAPGHTDGALDGREAAPRTEEERAFVLEQMRLFLASVVAVQEGLATGDLEKVATEAAARGRKANVTLARPPALAAKESEAWKAMMGNVRDGFDRLAAEARAKGPTGQMLQTLSGAMQNCVACHQAYRITTAAR